MAKKGKRSKVGRPPKPKEQLQDPPQLRTDEIKHIADDEDCENIFKVLASSSAFKHVTKTGPSSNRTTDAQILKQIQESQKKLKKMQEELDIKEGQCFFLNQKSLTLKIENGKLIDSTKYMQISYKTTYPQYNSLIDKLNIVAKGLDEPFIQILDQILNLYIDLKERGSRYEEIVHEIIEYIRNSSNDQKDPNDFDFTYLFKWERLKNTTKHAKIERMKDELLQKQQKISSKKSKKVIEKHQDIIQSQLNELEEESKEEPIDFVVKKLISIFEKVPLLPLDPSCFLQGVNFGQ